LACHLINSAPGGVAHEDFQRFPLREGKAGRKTSNSAGSDVSQAVAPRKHVDPFKNAAMSIGCGQIG